MISFEVQFRRTFSSDRGPAGEKSHEPSVVRPSQEEAAVPLHQTDTMQISVKAKEKTVNYDSIFRSIRPADKPEPAASAAPGSAAQPLTGPQIQAGKGTIQQPAGYPVTGVQQNVRHPDAHRQDLAARGVMTAGLTLILLGVMLELFLKRKGLVFLVTGMLALLAGMILR